MAIHTVATPIMHFFCHKFGPIWIGLYYSTLIHPINTAVREYMIISIHSQTLARMARRYEVPESASSISEEELLNRGRIFATRAERREDGNSPGWNGKPVANAGEIEAIRQRDEERRVIVRQANDNREQM